jgi:Zn-dependent protease
MRAGRAAGIPVGVHWSVAAVAFAAGAVGGRVLPSMAGGQPTAAYWAVAAAAALLFVAALLVHELGHAFAARRAGVGVTAITLWALGGVAEFSGRPRSARADLTIALAGPAASLATAALCAGTGLLVWAVDGPALAVAGLAWLAVMNGLLAIINLLPGSPLDGGQVLRALLWMRHRDWHRATRAAAAAGFALGLTLAIVGLARALTLRDADGVWVALAGALVTSAARAESAAQRARDSLAGVWVRDVMTPHKMAGATWMTVGGFAEHVIMTAFGSEQTVFPVTGPDGRLAGVVALNTLGSLPPADHFKAPLAQVMAAVPEEYLAAPGDPAAPLLSRPPLAGQVAAVVTDGTVVTGLVITSVLNARVKRTRPARAWARRPPPGGLGQPACSPPGDHR